MFMVAKVRSLWPQCWIHSGHSGTIIVSGSRFEEASSSIGGHSTSKDFVNVWMANELSPESQTPRAVSRAMKAIRLHRRTGSIPDFFAHQCYLRSSTKYGRSVQILPPEVMHCSKVPVVVLESSPVSIAQSISATRRSCPASLEGVAEAEMMTMYHRSCRFHSNSMIGLVKQVCRWLMFNTKLQIDTQTSDISRSASSSMSARKWALKRSLVWICSGVRTSAILSLGLQI
jgi:hypothetical protein